MAKRNKALDQWLDRSKEVNVEMAEDPEARAAAKAQADAENPLNPDDAEPDRMPAAVETTGPDEDEGNPDADADEAARAAAEADAAAAAVAAKPKDEAAPAEDERDRELKVERAKSARLAREREEARRQLAAARQEAAAAAARAEGTRVSPAPKPAENVEEEDPKPNRETHPVEYGEWVGREALRRADAAEARAAALEERLQQSDRQAEMRNRENQFRSMMNVEEDRYKAENPDFEDRLNHIKHSLRLSMRNANTPEHEIEAQLRDRETRFLAYQVNVATQNGEPYPGQYALEKLAAEADVYGYTPGSTRAAAETTRVAPNGKKPTVDARTQVADGQRRATAARTATTMSAGPVSTTDAGEPMSAERFLRMSPAQRAVYKRQHPDTMDRVMSEGEENSGKNWLLAGR